MRRRSSTPPGPRPGLFPREELLKLREIGSDLEGHPTPRLSFVDVATGSLGQGICAAIGTALNARRIGSDYRTYVLLGDGEMAEGSVWEAASAGLHHRARQPLRRSSTSTALGQSQATQFGHDTQAIADRWTAFGWHAIQVDGHDVQQLLECVRRGARKTTGRPTVIVARTLKGKGRRVGRRQGRLARQGVQEGRSRQGGRRDRGADDRRRLEARRFADPQRNGHPPATPADYSKMPAPAYKMGDLVATREAWGTGARRRSAASIPRVVALDADVKNSTFSDRFEKAARRIGSTSSSSPSRSMVGAAMGLAARGAIPFPSTFACFLTRASDFIRMAGISTSNVKLAGSHAGDLDRRRRAVADGARGSLDDARRAGLRRALSRATATSAERLVVEMAQRPGMAYMRTSRPKTPVIYGPDEKFPIGGSKVLRQSDNDVATVVGAGVTVFEALKAYDTLKAEGIDDPRHRRLLGAADRRADDDRRRRRRPAAR